MLVLTEGLGSLHIGYETFEVPWETLAATFYERFLAFLMLNRGFYPIFDVWLKNHRHEFGQMMIMFDGHAGHHEKQWKLCADAPYDRTVQDFVNEHDGKGMLILLLCCNPKNRGRITSKKSLVIYSRSAMTLNSMESKRSRQIMHIPGHGDFIGTTDEVKLRKIASDLGYKS